MPTGGGRERAALRLPRRFAGLLQAQISIVDEKRVPNCKKGIARPTAEDRPPTWVEVDSYRRAAGPIDLQLDLVRAGSHVEHLSVPSTDLSNLSAVDQNFVCADGVGERASTVDLNLGEVDSATLAISRPVISNRDFDRTEQSRAR